MPTPELKQAGEAVKIPPSRNNLPPKLYFFRPGRLERQGAKITEKVHVSDWKVFSCLVSKLVMVLEISIFW